MEKKDRSRPTTEESNYGQHMKAIGYAKGYRACEYDRRRIKMAKDRALFLQFNKWLEHVDDVLWSHRRK